MLSSLLGFWNQGHCSWFWDKVCGVDIGLECYDHDAAYDAGGLLRKIKSDYSLAVGIIRRSKYTNRIEYKLIIVTVGVCSWLAVSTIGWGFWINTRIQQRTAKIP